MGSNADFSSPFSFIWCCLKMAVVKEPHMLLLWLVTTKKMEAKTKRLKCIFYALQSAWSPCPLLLPCFFGNVSLLKEFFCHLIPYHISSLDWILLDVLRSSPSILANNCSPLGLLVNLFLMCFCVLMSEWGMIRGLFVGDWEIIWHPHRIFHNRVLCQIGRNLDIHICHTDISGQQIRIKPLNFLPSAS